MNCIPGYRQKPFATPGAAAEYVRSSGRLFYMNATANAVQILNPEHASQLHKVGTPFWVENEAHNQPQRPSTCVRRMARFELADGNFLGVMVGNNTQITLHERGSTLYLIYAGTTYTLSPQYGIEEVIEELERGTPLCNQ